jgi:hypothetical protein
MTATAKDDGNDSNSNGNGNDDSNSNISRSPSGMTTRKATGLRLFVAN